MTKQTVKKQSGLAIFALFVSVPIWSYLIVVFLCRDVLHELLTMDKCTACVYEEFWGPVLKLIVLVAILIFPLLIYSISSVSSIIVCLKNTHKKGFAIAALINNGLSIVTACLIILILSIFW